MKHIAPPALWWSQELATAVQDNTRGLVLLEGDDWWQLSDSGWVLLDDVPEDRVEAEWVPQ